MAALFHAMSYVSGYVVLALLALCITTGLSFAAEVAEVCLARSSPDRANAHHARRRQEHPTWAHVALQLGIWIGALLHAMLWLLDDFPLLVCASGVVAHALFALLLGPFPQLRLQSPGFVLSMLGLAVENWAWYTHFQHHGWEYSGAQISGFFFLYVWLVPLGFFVSVTLDDQLPGCEPLRAPSAGATIATALRGLLDMCRRVRRRQAKDEGADSAADDRLRWRTNTKLV